MQAAALPEAAARYARTTHGMKAAPDLAEAERVRQMYQPARLHEPYPSLDDVDEAEAVEAFRRYGFIAIADVFNSDEVETYRAAITHAVHSDVGESPWKEIVDYEPRHSAEALAAMTLEERELAVRKLFRFTDHLPGLAAAATHPKLVGVCELLTGEGVRMMQDMALLKPPGGGVEKPWHQDTAYFRLATPEKVIGTWTALDPARPSNGCMHVIPGSHTSGPKPHYHDRDCQLPDDTIDATNIVAVPLDPGGAMFFSGMLHHGTPPNTSADRRRALQFHYMTESAVNAEDAETLASLFYDKTGFAGCQGWALGMKTRPIHLRADF